MRRALLFRSRADFVATLLQKGRLADMMMQQHFAAQGEKSATVGGDAAMRQRREATKTPAKSNEWLATWCVLPQSRETVRAEAAGGDSARWTLRGSFTAVAPSGEVPASVRLVASTNDGAAVVVAVPMAQSGEKVRSGVSGGGGFRTVVLAEAEGSVVTDAGASVDKFDAERNVLAAAACSEMLGKLEEICALHATHTSRYDALLVRNPAVQKRLSQLACARFGVDALSSYVVDARAEDESIPLVESVALCMYAKRVLAAGVESAREIIYGTETKQAVPHRSKPERLIDYAYARQLFESERYVLSSLDGSTAAQSMRHFAPLLAQSQMSPNASAQNSLMTLLLGGDNGAVRLVAPHMNLRVSTTALENDIAAMLHRIREQKKRDDPLFVMAMAQYAAEVFANVAVVYRTTASLSREDDNAPRDWLLAQAFCAESSARRAMILRDLDISTAARKAVGKLADLNDCKTHPVELMNAEPVRKKTTAGVESAGMKMAN